MGELTRASAARCSPSSTARRRRWRRRAAVGRRPPGRPPLCWRRSPFAAILRNEQVVVSRLPASCDVATERSRVAEAQLDARVAQLMRSLASAALLLALAAPALAVVLPASIAQPALRVAPRCAGREGQDKPRGTASVATFLNENLRPSCSVDARQDGGRQDESQQEHVQRRLVEAAAERRRGAGRREINAARRRRGARKPDEEVITELPFDARAASLEELQWKLIELSTALGQHTATASLLATRHL